MTVCRFCSISPGNVRLTIWVQKVANSGQPIQSVAHWPFVSDVQATTRPRPYCHSDRMGSPCAEARIGCAVGLGVVATYPFRSGSFEGSMPFRMGLTFVCSG